MYDRAERVQIHDLDDLDPEKLLLEKDREAYHKVVPDFLGTEGQLNLLVIQDMRKDANKLLEDNKISHEKWQQIQDTLGAVDRNYWAESTVEQDPLMAAAMPVFIGADYLFKKIAETSAGRKVLKKLGYTPGRSKASAESIIQGFR
jgi:hypothetical protein